MRVKFLVKEPNNEHYYSEYGVTWEAREKQNALDQLEALRDNLRDDVIMIETDRKESEVIIC